MYPPLSQRPDGFGFWIMDRCHFESKQTEIRQRHGFSSETIAFTLVEVAVSLGIFTFCILAIASLLLSGMSTERHAGEEQGAAALLANLNLSVEYSIHQEDDSYQPLYPLEAWKWYTGTTNVISGTSEGYAYWLKISRVGSSGIPLINVRTEVAWPADAVSSWDSEGKPSTSQGRIGNNFFFLLR